MTPAAYVYIMASQRNDTLYVGSTTDLARRASEHARGAVDGFTKKYGCRLLVWYEPHETRWSALEQERRVKGWKRAWKIRLIEELNPRWADLSGDLAAL